MPEQEYDFFEIRMDGFFLWHHLILRARPEPPKSAGTFRNVSPLANIPFYAQNRRFRMV